MHKQRRPRQKVYVSSQPSDGFIAPAGIFTVFGLLAFAAIVGWFMWSMLSSAYYSRSAVQATQEFLKTYNLPCVNSAPNGEITVPESPGYKFTLTCKGGESYDLRGQPDTADKTAQQKALYLYANEYSAWYKYGSGPQVLTTRSKASGKALDEFWK